MFDIRQDLDMFRQNVSYDNVIMFRYLVMFRYEFSGV